MAKSLNVRMDRLLRSVMSKYPLTALGDLVWRLEAERVDKQGFFLAEHVFVVGCGHSGTSVLLSRLDNHSAVTAIRGESRFFQLDPIRRAASLRKWVKLWKPPGVLAEKTPIHIRYCGELKATFPNAHIVAICRHPLDVVASLYLRHKGDLHRAIGRWCSDNSHVIRESAEGKIAMVVRYEEFVISPEKVLNQIQLASNLCLETGLSENADEKKNWYFDTDAEGQHGAADNVHARRRQSQINQDIFDGRGKYLKVFTSDQIDSVWSHTSEIASQLGYGRTPWDPAESAKRCY